MSKINLNILIGVWVLMMALTGQVIARTIYVDANTPDNNDGSSWAKAYKYLQDGLADANFDPCFVEVYVADGNYYPDANTADPCGTGNREATFQLINGVALYGGFAGYGATDPNARDIRLYETILSGDLDANDTPGLDPCDLPDDPNRGENSYHVVTGSGTDANAVLDGFTITGTEADADLYGGGMYNYNSSPTVNNCMFSGNTAALGGGGMCNYSSSPAVTNCIFTGNSALWGGGMYNAYESNPTVTNCIFTGNSGSSYGGGMYNDHNCSPTVTNCTFTGNSGSSYGGGMHNFYFSSPTVTNCSFIGNSCISGPGGGMYNDFHSSPSVTNCSFSGNSSTLFVGGGMSNNNDSSPTVTNCILWGNTPDEIYNYDGTSTPTVTFSDVEGGYTGTGNINANPLFVDIASGNLRLQGFSQCIDAGDNDALPADTPDLDNDGNTTESIPFDLDGNARIDSNGNAVVDMGAFEFNGDYPVHNITQNILYTGIQTAINYANDYDQIEVAPGTYNEAIDFIGKFIHLYSSAGPEVTTINGTGHYHVVQCVSGENFNTIFEGFTITGGNANGTDPNDQCGGGMYNGNSSPTVTNCNFSGNSASSYGGGMHNFYQSSPTVTNCTFRGNSAGSFGGGMYNKNDSSPTVTDCTFSGNSADQSGGGGGGMCNLSSPTVTNCNFSGNSAFAGGGMCNLSSPAVTNCIFTGNSANKGGGMYNFVSNPTVTNCTFSGNTASSNGGGMCNVLGGSLTVTNCILWDNTPDEIIDWLSTATVTFSDVQGGYTGTGNINAAPCFVNANSPDPNLWNLRLKPESPCIDVGDNLVIPPPIGLSTDFDGRPRIADGDCNTTEIVDMGAYEFSWVYIGDFYGGCDVDFVDFSVLGLTWLLEEQEAGYDPNCDISLPPDGVVDEKDLKIFTNNWLAGK
jgi:hypothetical protein